MKELMPWQRKLLVMMERGPLRLIVTRRGGRIESGPSPQAEAKKLYRRVRRSLR